MPLPVLVLIVVGVVSVLVGTTVALNWDKVVVAFKGKRLAVLGAREVGKTHMISFLTTGSIPAEYKRTTVQRETKARRFHLRDLEIIVKDSDDTGGDKAFYGEWKLLHDQADVVFYLLRADRLIAGDGATESRVRDDLQHIGRWLDSRSPRPPFFIIGTHCDLDPSFGSLTGDKMGEYVDSFRRLPIVAELVARGGGSSVAKVVLGSMKTIEDTEALVYQVFMQVSG